MSRKYDKTGIALLLAVMATLGGLCDGAVRGLSDKDMGRLFGGCPAYCPNWYTECSSCCWTQGTYCYWTCTCINFGACQPADEGSCSMGNWTALKPLDKWDDHEAGVEYCGYNPACSSYGIKPAGWNIGEPGYYCTADCSNCCSAN